MVRGRAAGSRDMGGRGTCCQKDGGRGIGHLPAIPAVQTLSLQQLPGLLISPNTELQPSAT